MKKFLLDKQKMQDINSLSEDEFEKYCLELERDNLNSIRLYIELFELQNLKNNVKLNLILNSLKENKNITYIYINKGLININSIELNSVFNFLLAYIRSFNKIKTLNIENCSFALCRKELIAEWFEMLLLKESIISIKLIEDQFLDLEPGFLLHTLEKMIAKKPDLKITLWDEKQSLKKLPSLIQEEINEFAKIELLTHPSQIFTFKESEELVAYLKYFVKKIIKLEKKPTILLTRLICEKKISVNEFISIIKEIILFDTNLPEKIIDMLSNLHSLKVLFEDDVFLILNEIFFSDLIEIGNNTNCLKSLFIKVFSSANTNSVALIEKMATYGLQIPEEVISILQLQEEKISLTVENCMFLIEVLQQKKILFSQLGWKEVLKKFHSYIYELSSISTKFKIKLICLYPQYHLIKSSDHNLSLNFTNKIFFEPCAERMQLAVGLLKTFGDITEQSLIPMITSIVSRVLDKNNSSTKNRFFIECFNQNADGYNVPSDLKINDSINKEDLQIMLSLAIANNNSNMAMYILSEMKKNYGVYLPKKSTDPIIISIFVSHYELTTILTKENSTEYFINQIKKCLPKNAVLQIITWDLKERAPIVNNPYISGGQKNLGHKNYNVVDYFNEILFNEKLFEDMFCSDIIFFTLNPNIEEDFFIKKYNESIITVNCSVFSPFFEFVLKNIRKLSNYDHALARNMQNLDLHSLIRLKMFADLKGDFGFSKKLKPLLLSKTPSNFSSNKNLVFLTDAPYGTLGDVSAASKAISCFQRDSKYKEYEFFWIVREPNGKIKASDLIPENVKIIYIYQWKDMRYNIEIMKLLLSNPLLISYPTFHYLSNEDKQFLTNYGAFLTSITEYDYLDESINIEELYSCSDNECFMETGLNDRAIGIFIKQPNTIKEKDLAYYDIWLNKQINSNHHIFFGYLNKDLDNVSHFNYVTPAKFALICIKKALQKFVDQDLIIDILCTFTLQDFKIIKEEVVDLPISSLSFLTKDTNDFQREEFSLFKKRGSSRSFDVRLLNPFPLAHHDIELLLKRSDPLVALTGDSSFTEGIERHKVILYQIMEWKKNWFESYTEYTKNALARKSVDNPDLQLTPKLCKFLELQNCYDTKDDELLEIIVHHEDELIAKTKEIHKNLVEHNSLYNNFTRAVTAKGYLSGAIKMPLYQQVSQGLLQNLSVIIFSDFGQVKTIKPLLEHRTLKQLKDIK